MDEKKIKNKTRRRPDEERRKNENIHRVKNNFKNKLIVLNFTRY